MPNHKELREKGHRDWMWLNNDLLRIYLPIIKQSNWLAVYCVLALHADKTTQKSKLYHRTLAREAGCSIAAVQRIIDELVKHNLLAVESGKLNGHANTYVLLRVPQSVGGSVTVMEGSVIKTEGPPGGSVTVTDIKPEQNINQMEGNQNNSSPPPDGDETPPPVPHVATFDGNHRADHQAIVDAISLAYEEANETKPFWTPKAFGILKREIDRLHGLSTAQWLYCVKNRFASDGVAVGDLPETFIPYLHRYLSGPLDRFNKLKEYSHAEVSPRAGRQQAAVEEAIRRLQERVRSDPEFARRAAGPGPR